MASVDIKACTYLALCCDKKIGSNVYVGRITYNVLAFINLTRCVYMQILMRINFILKWDYISAFTVSFDIKASTYLALSCAKQIGNERSVCRSIRHLLPTQLENGSSFLISRRRRFVGTSRLNYISSYLVPI